MFQTRLTVALGLLAVMAGALAGCGGGSVRASASTPTTANQASAAADRARFASCLEAHGVPSVEASGPGSVPSSASPPPTDPDRAKYQTAFEDCRSQLGLHPGASGFRDSSAAKAFFSCLEQHGVTLPSPGQSGGSEGARSGTASNPDPTMRAAAQACAKLRPHPVTVPVGPPVTVPATTTPTTTR